MISVPLPAPLMPARFKTRLNRFLLSVELESTGEVVEAHMADPGRLRELLLEGRRILLAPANAKARRTRWSAALVEAPSGSEWVSLDSTLPNRLIRTALKARALQEFQGWRLERSEVTVGGSRLDFLLRDGADRRLALEVKSVTLVEDGIALFPDAVTTRGARHVAELTEVALTPGWEAAILFVLQRGDGQEIRAARSIDPVFSAALEEAREAGVRVLGRRCRVSQEGIELGPPVPAGVG